MTIAALFFNAGTNINLISFQEYFCIVQRATFFCLCVFSFCAHVHISVCLCVIGEASSGFAG